MPEILNPYSISDLPQTSSPLPSCLAVAFGSHSKVYFGVSHSALTGYSLKTTAKPLWTHPVSPVTTISAVCHGTTKNSSNTASTNNNNNNNNTHSVIYYASVNPKGKAFLHQVVPRSDAQGESEEHTLISKCEYISAIQQSKQQENTCVYLVFSSGQVQAFSVQNKKEEDNENSNNNGNDEESKALEASPIWTIPAPAKGQKVLATKFLKAPSKDLPQDGLAVTVTTSSTAKISKQFVLSVVSLDSSEGRVLSTKTVSIPNNEEIGAFDIAGNDLFRYVASTGSIYRYNLLDPTANPQYTMKLPLNSKDDKSPKPSLPPSSILYVGNDQVLVSHGCVLRLVDLKYSVLLSERNLPQPVKLATYKKKLSLIIGHTVPLTSSTTSSNEKIVAIPVEVGTGSLLESIGKGVSQPQQSLNNSIFRNAFTQIPTVFRENSGSVNMVKEEASLVKNARAEANAVLLVLRHLLDTQNVTEFEKWALAYFKVVTKWIKGVTATPNVEDIISKTTVPELPSATTNNATDANTNETSEAKRVFYKAKYDRAVDSSFVYDLCTIIFKHVGKTGTSPLSSLVPGDIGVNTSSSSNSLSKGTVRLVKLHKNFAPERLIGYLLTHPLLPTQQLPGLLLTLNRFPELVRIAFKRAPAALRCDTVVSALRTRDDDTFSSAIIRLEHKFDARQIIASLQRVYLSNEGKLASDSSSSKSKKSSKSSNSSTTESPNSTKPFLDITYPDNGTTLETIIRRMVSLDLGWSLVPYFVDAGGLFGWDDEFLVFLDTAVAERLNMYKSGYEVIAMLEEGIRESKRRGHGAGNVGGGANIDNNTTDGQEPLLVSAKKQNQQRLKAVLPIGFSGKYAYGKKAASNPNGERAASAIASYTVERLLL